MRQTLRGIVARSDAPPSVRYVRRVSAWQASRSAWFFIQVRRPVLRFTRGRPPRLDTLDYITPSGVCQEEFFLPSVSDLETSRCSTDSLDYSIRPPFCQL